MKRLLLMLCIMFGISICVSAQKDDGKSLNKGFIHPGGLHTQADFDRVRAQLAAGNPKVTQAYNVLKTAGYAQPGLESYPLHTIIRGGGVGENYITAARAATMAYQNGLRWKIEDNEACAKTAVKILMEWARTTKYVSGDSNAALAYGLYGYQFAQAAELVRDYAGWSREDFEEFKRWMLDLWYPGVITFLRTRNGTWDNGGKWWDAPGHYWSNWGLCNVLCCISIGILCDDVYIYNQGMSFFKYDQCGTYADPHPLYEITAHEGYDGEMAIHNDGLADFLGNLVYTHVDSELETGAYGKLGQMNESGRDAGHAGMAVGLAIDLAKVGYDQGDDLFAYMDHRLAAGIEFAAAQAQSVPNLPWTYYIYANNGFYYHDGRSWLMVEPCMGVHIRPCWGTAIGIYEGVKGVKMPFSEWCLNEMGIDGGGAGSVSGGYDHLGYSVLMNTYDEQLAPADKVPTELSPKMEYSGTLNNNLIPSLTVERTLGNIDGKITNHNELGGLVNTYNTNNNTTVPTGQTLRLMPQLPEGETDTGQWSWNTGETTREITVKTDSSYIYRVTYTNKNGVESQLCFPIAVKGDCENTYLPPVITYEGTTYETDTIDVLYGKSVTLSVNPQFPWGTYKWSTNATTQSVTISSVKADQDVSVTFTNSGGAVSTRVFHIHVLVAVPYYILNGETVEAQEVIVEEDGAVTLGITTPSTVTNTRVTWNTGDTGKTLELTDLKEGGDYTVTFTLANEEYTYDYKVMVKSKEPAAIGPGNFMIQDVVSGKFLTGHGLNQAVTFEEGKEGSPAEGQTWFLEFKSGNRHCLMNLPDSLTVSGSTGKLSGSALYPFYFDNALGTELYAMRTTAKYWTVSEEDGTFIRDNAAITGFPYRLIPVEGLRGDVNEDGAVNINDVVAIINVMAGTAAWPNANVNGDAEGIVDINDVVAVINIMAGN